MSIWLTVKEGEMSYLRNPSFELGKILWKPINQAGSVTFDVGTSTNPAPVSGQNIASVVSLAKGGSIGQDVSGVNAPSVTALAYVTSVSAGVDGALTISNLNTATVQAAAFRIQNPGSWLLIVNTVDLGGAANVRVELFVNTAGAQLSIDSVNLF